MTSLLHKFTKRDMDNIIRPDTMIEWLSNNVGQARRTSYTLMDADVPAEGDNWRIVKLYQRIGDGTFQYSIYIEFQSPTDFMHFKLVWG